jgi:nucleotide-binding universal stress UspA family protein
MSIVCGITARVSGDAPDAAFEAAHALAQRAPLGPLHRIELDAERDAADVLMRAAAEQRADLLVVAGRYPGEPIGRIAHQATVPVLVVRDPAPFVRWGFQRGPLRAVFGWDDTTTTAAALAPVVAMRRAGPVDVEVVHVYFPDEAARRYGVKVASMVDPDPDLEALLHRDIAHQLGDLPGDGTIRITPALGLGHIGEHLLDRVGRAAADLVIAGTHHRHGLRRLSSVAERLLGEATTSVMLVPVRPDLHLSLAPEFRVAVVATDGSAFANCAVPYAYRLIRDGGEVHLIRVVEPGDSVDDQTLVARLLELRPEARAATRTVAHVVRDGDPAHAITVAAERVGADVVCIASHARGGIVRALIGSTTDRLLHVCRRPVLVVHPVE